MRYVDFGTTGTLYIPQLQCSECGKFQVQPELVGCWPSAPCAGEVWYDQLVLDHFYHLRNTGTSMVAFCSSVEALLPPDDEGKPVKLHVSTFSQAYRCVHKVNAW